MRLFAALGLFGAVSGVHSPAWANFTSGKVERTAAGTFAGGENRFFPREIELALFRQIDPYARGEVRPEAAEEFEVVCAFGLTLLLLWGLARLGRTPALSRGGTHA